VRAVFVTFLLSGCAATSAQALQQTLSQRDVYVSVKKQVPLLQGCFNGEERDKVTVSYAIAPDGKIAEVQASSVENDAALQCVISSLASYTFERSQFGVAEVTFPVPVIKVKPARELPAFADVFQPSSMQSEAEDEEEDVELGDPEVEAPAMNFDDSAP